MLQLPRGRHHVRLDLRRVFGGRWLGVGEGGGDGEGRQARPRLGAAVLALPASLHKPSDDAGLAAAWGLCRQRRPHLLQPLMRLGLLVRQDGAVLLNGGLQAGLAHVACTREGREGGGRWRAARAGAPGTHTSGRGGVRAALGPGCSGRRCPAAAHRCSAQTAARCPRWPRFRGPQTCGGAGWEAGGGARVWGQGRGGAWLHGCKERAV